ncbi:hypothetical protein EX30DRAFT_373284 [Ascodesmis nigricans]|uniref:Decapping nuclease n=1 Tax=Ascodesmis nigricans TaxID=341454 RepID=A0A4S2MSP8_9PEZI|nr:hypothetical protein EX30DRAFT_373284 [Ascodesmis nigricans]
MSSISTETPPKVTPGSSHNSKKKKRIALRSATPVHRINLEKIPLDPSLSYHKEDYRVLTSYNLKSNHSIVVPGSPAVYTPSRQQIPFSLQPDAGNVLADPNRHVFGTCPHEPLIRSIKLTTSDYDFKKTDFIIDRRNMRWLLEFCSSRNSQQERRIDVECVGPNNTILVYTNLGPTRRRGDSFGYGHNFEDAVTRKTKYFYGPRPEKGGVPGKVLGHWRACSYTLGGINICQRFEVDACYSGPSGIENIIPCIKHDFRIPHGQPTSFVHGKCTIHKAGFLAAPHTIMELKTRKFQGENQKESGLKSKFFEQVWFSDTPWLVLGRHRKGCFTDVQVKNVQQELELWAERNKDSLRRLAALLKMIQDFMKESPSKNVAIIWRKAVAKELLFYDIEGSLTAVELPPDLKELWK